MWKIISDGLTRTERRIETTRLESWSLPGLPDVLLLGERGEFGFIELKAVKQFSRKVDLSPHQVAWLSRHSHGRCFIVVRDSSLDIRVFRGSDAVSLRMDGASAVEALAVFKAPYDWDEFFQLTCPL